jgi:hypothetical protein
VSNVTILTTKEFPVPEGAPPSETPLAELVLGAFPKVREHYAERDVLVRLEDPPVIIPGEARAGWAALAQDISDAAETGRALLADWWRKGWAETFQRPPFWTEAPAARPYVPPAGPNAEPEPVSSLALRPASPETVQAAAVVSATASPPAAEPEPDGAEYPEDDPSDHSADCACTDCADRERQMARIHAERDAAAGPAPTAVIPAAGAETEVVPVVEDKEGGEEK